MHIISRRGGKRLLNVAIISAATSSLLLIPSLASAHAIAGDRVFPATMAIDDPGVGDEANLVYGHQRVQATMAIRASIRSTSSMTS